MKWFALFLVVALQCSCTTLENRRDLYSPRPAPDSPEMMKRRTSTTTTTTTTIKTEAPEESAVPPPAFR